METLVVETNFQILLIKESVLVSGDPMTSRHAKMRPESSPYARDEPRRLMTPGKERECIVELNRDDKEYAQVSANETQ